jgi:hypothetical protein
VATTPDTWAFAYVVPAEALSVFAVLPPLSSNDYSQPFFHTGIWDTRLSNSAAGIYTPQEFQIEQSGTGDRVLYTDQEEAVARYVIRVVDASRYSQLFRLALSWHLASMLAGAIIKGVEGARMSEFASKKAGGFLAQAGAVDGNQRESHPEHIVPWMARR